MFLLFYKKIIFGVHNLEQMNKPAHLTQTLLMIRPASFGFNKETAVNNAFQNEETSLSSKEITENAIDEFDQFVKKIQSADVEVIVAQDEIEPAKPDAVFPNNWVSFHEDGTLVLYPMNAENRRIERSVAVLNEVLDAHQMNKKIDLSTFEHQNIFLEGTGSMVLDRRNKIAYACLSPRTDAKVLDTFCKFLSFRPVAFDSIDQHGQAIYHTNVMMALGENYVAICLDSIKDEGQRKQLIQSFEATNKEIIDLSFDQINQFAGNMLQVKNKKGTAITIMSEQAYKSLTEKQIDQLKKQGEILYSPIYTIEQFGGGSARCMLAEVFLPKK